MSDPVVEPVADPAADLPPGFYDSEVTTFEIEGPVKITITRSYEASHVPPSKPPSTTEVPFEQLLAQFLQYVKASSATTHPPTSVRSPIVTPPPSEG